MQPTDYGIAADIIDSEREINRVIKSQMRPHTCASTIKWSCRLLRYSNVDARVVRGRPYTHFRCRFTNCETTHRSPTVHSSRNGPRVKCCALPRIRARQPYTIAPTATGTCRSTSAHSRNMNARIPAQTGRPAEATPARAIAGAEAPAEPQQQPQRQTAAIARSRPRDITKVAPRSRSGR
jgi:hypothetical protein